MFRHRSPKTTLSVTLRLKMTSVQSAAMKDEERLNLLEKGEYPPQVETVPTLKTSPPLGWRFVMIASINTIATVGIVCGSVSQQCEQC